MLRIGVRWCIAVSMACLPHALLAQADGVARKPPASATSQEAFLDLRTGKLLDAAASLEAKGPLLRGALQEGAFVPSRAVSFFERVAEPNPKLSPGWIELQTGEIHADVEGRAPLAPFLRGRIDPKAGFMVDPAALRDWQRGGLVMSISPLAAPARPGKRPSAEAGTIAPAPTRDASPGAPYAPATLASRGDTTAPAPACVPDYSGMAQTRLYRSHITRLGKQFMNTSLGNLEGTTRVREEALIFGPGMPQPAGTVPLYSIRFLDYDPGAPYELLDSFVSTAESLMGRQFLPDRLGRIGADSIRVLRGIVGYVFEEPQPGTIPLFGWYRQDPEDYFMTTDPAWSGCVGARRDGYVLVRIEGYAFPVTGPLDARVR